MLRNIKYYCQDYGSDILFYTGIFLIVVGQTIPAIIAIADFMGYK